MSAVDILFRGVDITTVAVVDASSNRYGQKTNTEQRHKVVLTP